MNQPCGPGTSRWTGGLVLAGSLLLVLQNGVVRVASPVIREDLRTSIGGIQAVYLAGLVVVTVSLVAFGRLADLVGPSRIYRAGLVAFATGSACSALAPSVAWLVAAQAGQGVGWAMCAGAGPALLVGGFPDDQRTRALAWNHMANAVGMAAGPALGGLVVEHLGWRWSFAAFAPAAVVLAVSTAGHLPVASDDRPRPRFDWTGSLLLGAALVGPLVVLADGVAADSGAGASALLLAAAAAGLFVRRELRVPDPLIDLHLFEDRAFSVGLAASFLTFVAMAANMFLMPFLLVDHLGLGTGRAGAVMLAMPLTVLAVAPLGGRLADRVGPRFPATAGLGAVTVAVAGMATIDRATPIVWIVAVLVVYGAGAGLFQSPNNSAVLGAAPPGRLGTAAGTLATVARLGQVAGIAVAGGLWQARLSHYPATLPGAGSAYRDTFLVLAVFGMCAVVASWCRGTSEVPSTPPLGAIRSELPHGH